MLKIDTWCQDGAYGSGDSVSVTMSPAAPVNRTGVQAGTTTNAFQGPPEFVFTQVFRASVIYNDQMDLFVLRWFLKMRGIGGYRLSGSTAGQ